MEAKELRIGNYILDHEAEPEKTIYWQVESIYKSIDNYYGVAFRNMSYETRIDYVEPIPLTEDWLLNFGFTNGELKITTIDNSFLLVFGAANEIQVLTMDCEQWIGRRVYYVHQLQNLYFALTQTELEIK